MSAKKEKELRKFARLMAGFHADGGAAREFVPAAAAGFCTPRGIEPGEFYRVMRQQVRRIRRPEGSK